MLDNSIILTEFENTEIVKHYIDSVNKIGLWNSEKEIFLQNVNETDRILDIGCGAGRTTFGLFQKGYHNIVGLDLSEKMIQACMSCNSKFNISFLVGDAQHLPFEKETMDVCFFSFNGLMGIPKANHRQNVVTETVRVLRPGGCFIFSVHDLDNPLFASYWNQKRIEWGMTSREQDWLEFGDVLVPEPKGDSRVLSYMHIPSHNEVYQALEKAGYSKISCIKMSQICQERDEVYRETSDFITVLLENREAILNNKSLIRIAGDLVFWVARK